jgi:hypothetical protein
MSEYGEPVLLDPQELEHGDQVGCTDAGPRLRPMVGDAHDEEPVWLTLGSEAWRNLTTWQGWTTHGMPVVLARKARA